MRKLPPLNALRTFEAAGRALSFTLAADELNVTQGAVSRQVKVLEEQIGFPLFVRSHRSLELTEEGKALLEVVTQSLDLLEGGVQGLIAPHQQQKLTILVAPTIATRWLAARLNKFQERYPQIEIAIHTEQMTDVSYDLEVRFGIEPRARGVSKQLMFEHQIAACSPSLFGDDVRIIFEEHAILHILNDKRRLDAWSNWMVQAGVEKFKPLRELEFSTQDQVINATVAGAGLAVLDITMIRELLDQGALVQIHPTECNGPYGYWLDIPSEKTGLGKVRKFSNWLMRQCNRPAVFE